MTTILEQGKHRLSKKMGTRGTSAQIGNVLLICVSINDCIPAIFICRGQFQGVCLKPCQRDAINETNAFKITSNFYLSEEQTCLCAPPEMYSYKLLARYQSRYEKSVKVKVPLTLITASIAEHMTIGSTGWMSAIEPRPVFSCVSSNRSHPTPFHSISSPSHRSHMRQAVGFCDSIELALKSGDPALSFSIMREASIVSVGDGSPRIPTLIRHSEVSISCFRSFRDSTEEKSLLRRVSELKSKAGSRTWSQQLRTSIRRYQMKSSCSSV